MVGGQNASVEVPNARKRPDMGRIVQTARVSARLIRPVCCVNIVVRHVCAMARCSITGQKKHH